MLDKILNIEKSELEELSFDDVENVSSWFHQPPGQEHYRLLSFISYLFKKQTLLDIGTYEGNSAVALASNPKNKVISYDIEPRMIIEKPNIEYRIGNVMDDVKLVLSSPFILLDTFHNGDFEQEFVDFLLDIKYQGMLMLDDIYLNKPMKKFWNKIKLEKYDLTSLGHFTGTGLVIFKYD